MLLSLITVQFVLWPSYVSCHFQFWLINLNFSFELIHCDLWGPFSVPDHNGIRFFLTIVDDFTRCTWVYLLQYKSQTQGYINYFFHFVYTQFNLKIKTICIDFGTEFHFPNFFTSTLVLLLLSKVALSNVSINIYLMLLVL